LRLQESKITLIFFSFEYESYTFAILTLTLSIRKLLAENLDSCSIEELHQIEAKIEQSLQKIRGKKVYICLKYIFLFNILTFNSIKVPDIYCTVLPEPSSRGSDSKTKGKGNLQSSPL
jgi:K-box region